jgi:hypothetical protein
LSAGTTVNHYKARYLILLCCRERLIVNCGYLQPVKGGITDNLCIDEIGGIDLRVQVAGELLELSAAKLKEVDVTRGLRCSQTE